MVNVRLVCLLVFKLLNTLGLKFPQKVTRALLTFGDGLLKGDYLGQVGQKDRVSWGVVGFGWWLLQVCFQQHDCIGFSRDLWKAYE